MANNIWYQWSAIGIESMESHGSSDLPTLYAIVLFLLEIRWSFNSFWWHFDIFKKRKSFLFFFNSNLKNKFVIYSRPRWIKNSFWRQRKLDNFLSFENWVVIQRNIYLQCTNFFCSRCLKRKHWKKNLGKKLALTQRNILRGKESNYNVIFCLNVIILHRLFQQSFSIS